ncbi:MAG: hypothetical protein JWM80_5535 [Cyanobacteria bacterium RYN_339]|nr:hypothetical protein [Cyanobacteria bacterium RYN_339]
MMRARWQGFVGLALVALIGCTVSGRGGGTAVRQDDLAISASPRSASVLITVEDRSASAYGLKYVRELDWETAVATLTNTNPAILPVSQSAAAVVNSASLARSATFSLAPVAPAGGYSLQIDLQRRSSAGALQTVATGSNANFTVAAGPNPVAVTLALNANGQLVVTVPTGAGSSNALVAPFSTYGHFTLVRQAGGSTQGVALGTDPLSATFTQVGGIESDSDGNLYVVDTGAHQIRLVPPSGPTSVLAGSAAGTSGSTGDGGAATSALLSSPNGIVRDPATGVIYFCDTGNNRIRFVRPNGIISTVAGGGVSVAASVNPATGAALNAPFDLVGDAAGNVFFTEGGSGRVRRLDPTGALTTLTTLATPKALAIDRANKLLWVEDGTQVRLISNIYAAPSLAGSPVYTSPSTVRGLAFDQVGTLFIAEGAAAGTAFVRIQRLPVGNSGSVLTGRQTEAIAGTGASSGLVSDYVAPTTVIANALTQLLAGAGHEWLHLDSSASNLPGVIGSTLYMASNYTAQFAQVLRLDPRSPVDPTPTPVPPQAPTPPPVNGGVVTTFAGSNAVGGSTDGAGTAAQFQQPKGVAADANGNVYVADYSNNTIRKITPAGAVTTYAGTPGGGSTVDGQGAAARFNQPAAVAVDANGVVYVAERGAIRKIDTSANVTTLAGNGNVGGANGTGAAARFYNPGGLCVDVNGTVWVADAQNKCIRKVTAAGVVTTFAGVMGNGGYRDGVGTGAQFRQVLGIAQDYLGNLYVADSNNNVIRKIAPDATVTTYSGSNRSGYVDGTKASALFNRPSGVAMDAGGFLYVADQYNNCLRKVTPTGTVSTLAGLGGCCNNDVTDGTGTVARFDRPYGLVILPNALLYVGDTNNNTIRKVQ